LAATVWITNSLLDQSIALSSTGQLDAVSKSLSKTGKEFYQRACDDLKEAASSGRAKPIRYTPANRVAWPEPVQAFAAGAEPDKFRLAGNEGDRLEYLVRHGAEVWSYSEGLDVPMDRLSREIRDARAIVEAGKERDWGRGLKLAYVLLAASIWVVSLALLVYLAHRVSRPIHQLTAGLSKLAAGDLNARVQERRDDEIGRAIQAFNHMADKLQEST